MNELIRKFVSLMGLKVIIAIGVFVLICIVLILFLYWLEPDKKGGNGNEI